MAVNYSFSNKVSPDELEFRFNANYANPMENVLKNPSPWAFSKEDWNLIFEKDYVERIQKLFPHFNLYHQKWIFLYACERHCLKIAKFFIFDSSSNALFDVNFWNEIATKILITTSTPITSNTTTKKNNQTQPTSISTPQTHPKAFEMLNLFLKAQPQILSYIFHWSVANNRVDVVRFFIENGTSPDLSNKFGKKTPLHLASEFGYFEIVKLLVDFEANLNLVNDKLQSALYIATAHSKNEIVKYLISKGADVGISDSRGENPLHRACSNENFELVELFVSKSNVDVNLTTDFGSTSLMIAASRGNLQIAKCLVEVGKCNVNQRNKQGDSAFEFAKGNSKMLKYLESQVNVTVATSRNNNEINSSGGNGGVKQFFQKLLKSEK